MSMTGNGLVKLLEECAELSEVAAKKLAYYKTDNHPDGKGSLKLRLEQEIADVYAACDLVTANFGLNTRHIELRRSAKLETFAKWTSDSSNNREGVDL